MDRAMTASRMSEGQIENAVDKFRAAMRKHNSEISSDIAQQVLGVENLGMDLFAPFRKHAEMISNMIVRRVKVDRTRTPQEALDATGRRQHIIDKDIVASMPKGEGDEVELVYFKPDEEAYYKNYKNGLISDADLEKEFDKYGLVPDPMAHAADNEADPAFADKHPSETHWKDKDGKWCYVAFQRWHDERRVYVYGGYRVDWRDLRWRFAGVRK